MLDAYFHNWWYPLYARAKDFLVFFALIGREFNRVFEDPSLLIVNGIHSDDVLVDPLAVLSQDLHGQSDPEGKEERENRTPKKEDKLEEPKQKLLFPRNREPVFAYGREVREFHPERFLASGERQGDG